MKLTTKIHEQNIHNRCNILVNGTVCLYTCQNRLGPFSLATPQLNEAMDQSEPPLRLMPRRYSIHQGARKSEVSINAQKTAHEGSMMGSISAKN